MAAEEVSKVVVICPKCSIKLKVDEAKLAPAGSKFKCPKCGAVLVVRRPAAQPKKNLDSSAVLVAHTNQALVGEIVSILTSGGYRPITASDGIDLMVRALKEFPFLAIVEVSLPKIYGFEVCRRLKARAETRDMKFILIPDIHDKTKYRREPTSLYGADDYIEEFDIPSQLMDKIRRLLGGAEEEVKEAAGKEQPSATPKVPAGDLSAGAASIKPPPPAGAVGGDELIEKARRLARTIINDIHLYNIARVEASIRAGDFYRVFAAEVKEGKKLYDSRISQEVRDKFDYFREAIDNFIAAKKEAQK